MRASIELDDDDDTVRISLRSKIGRAGFIQLPGGSSSKVDITDLMTALYSEHVDALQDHADSVLPEPRPPGP